MAPSGKSGEYPAWWVYRERLLAAGRQEPPMHPPKEPVVSAGAQLDLFGPTER